MTSNLKYKALPLLIVFFIILLCIVFYIWFDNNCNDDRISSEFIENTVRHDYRESYKLVNSTVKSIYSYDEFASIFKKLYNKNECLQFVKTRVMSSDNFKILVLDCKENLVLCKISFGGGWGKGWAITNIALN